MISPYIKQQNSYQHDITINSNMVITSPGKLIMLILMQLLTFSFRLGEFETCLITSLVLLLLTKSGVWYPCTRPLPGRGCKAKRKSCTMQWTHWWGQQYQECLTSITKATVWWHLSTTSSSLDEHMTGLTRRIVTHQNFHFHAVINSCKNIIITQYIYFWQPGQHFLL